MMSARGIADSSRALAWAQDIVDNCTEGFLERTVNPYANLAWARAGATEPCAEPHAEPHAEPCAEP
eukprot:9408131-Alexandrium_andersonii.AAC.1